MYSFLGGGASEKVYVLYTHLNVDNYEWPLSDSMLILLNKRIWTDKQKCTIITVNGYSLDVPQGIDMYMHCLLAFSMGSDKCN